MAETKPQGSSGGGAPAGRRRWGWGRRLGLAGVVVGLVLGAGIAAAPRIASWLAPGIASRAITGTINGRAEVGGVRLSWMGGQSVGPVEVFDAQGASVARVNIALDRGLWSLVRAGLGGSFDLGTVRVDGVASLERGPDGVLNVSRLPKAAAGNGPAGAPAPAPSPGPAEPIRLPGGLKAEVVIEGVEVRFVDRRAVGDGAGPAVRAVHVPKMTGRASVDGGAARAELSAAVLYGGAADVSSAKTPGGTLSVRVKVDDMARADGALTPEAASVEAVVDLSDLAVAAADALAGTGRGLVEAVGERLGAKVTVTGTLARAEAGLEIRSSGVNADVALVASDGVLSAARPGSISVRTDGARSLLGIDRALAGQDGVTIERLPDVSATLSELRVPLPIDPRTLQPRALDLRGAKVGLRVETGGASGTVRVPGPEGGGGAMRAYALSPLSVTVSSPDLAQGVEIRGGTSATLGGQPAGSLVIDVAARQLLDERGAVRPGGPREVRGEVKLASLATAIAQPIVDAAGIDLASGVGPTLDVSVVARSDPSAAAGGAIPPTEVDVLVQSKGVGASAALLLDERGVRTRDERTQVRVASVRALAGRAIQKAGFELTDVGTVEASLRRLVFPLDAQPVPAVERAELDASVALRGLGIRPVAPGGGASASSPLMLSDLSLGASSVPGRPPSVSVRGNGSHEGGAFTINGGFDLVGLRPVLGGRQRPFAVRPVGELVVAGLPTSVAGVFVRPSTEAGGLDVARLIRDAVGPTVEVGLVSSRRAGQAEGVDIALRTTAANVRGEVSASLDTRALSVSKVDARATLTPDLAGALLDALGPKLDSKPALTGPATLVVSASPVMIPFVAPAAGADPTFEPDLSRAGVAEVKLEIAGTTEVTRIMVRDEQGQSRDIGPLGLQDVLVSARLPLRSLASGSAAEEARVSVTAGVLGEAQRRIVDLQAGGSVAVAGGRPSGDLSATAKLAIADTRRIDALIGKPGLLFAGLGETAEVKAEASVSFPAASAGGGASGGGAGGFSKASLTASVSAPRMSTTQPLRATALPDRVSLDQPLVLSWQAYPGITNRYMLGISVHERPLPPGQEPDMLRFMDKVDLTVRVDELGLSLGGSGEAGPLRPGVFALRASVSAPQAKVKTSGVDSTLSGLSVRVNSMPMPGTIGFEVGIADVGRGPGSGQPAVSLRGRVEQLADGAGRLTPDAAAVTMDGTASDLPTALVDAIARQKGTIVEALGPTASMEVRAERFSKSGGTLSLRAASPRATLALQGRVEDGVFVTYGEPSAQLLEITPGLAGRFIKGLPTVGSIEKRREDGPAMVRMTGMRVPLDGDVSKLNGRVTVNLGTARFQTTEIFGRLLKLAGGQAAGMAGQRIEPFVVNIERGVATYERFTLPLGEFRLQTAGTVDLVRRTLDVHTYIPFGALSEETAKLFRLPGVGGLIEASSMMPFRTTGSFESPQTRPDLERFAKEAGKNLIGDPKQILEDPKQLEERLRGIFRRDRPKEGGGGN